MKPEIREKIRVKMAEKDWTNKDLAREVGITDASVSRILSGKQKTGKETLEKIYNVLDIDKDSVNTLHVGPIKTIYGRYAETWPPAEEVIVMTTSVDPSEFDETGYFYQVRDEACFPILQRGDKIFITYSNNAPIGDVADKICAVNYQGNDMLRAVRNRGGDVWLDPINRDGYKVIKANRTDLKILGIVDYVSKRSVPKKV